MSDRRTATVLTGLLVLAGAAACSGGPGTAGGAAPAAGTAASGSAGRAPGGAGTTAAAATPNGVEAQDARTIVDRSLAALRQARSVRITGQGSSDGQAVTFDLSTDTDGNCAGTMGLSGQGTFRLVKQGTRLWVKPDPVFWRSHGGPGAEQLIGDKYLKTTTDNTDFAEMGTVCDLGTLAGSLADASGDLARGQAATVDGSPAVTVAGSGPRGDSVLSVATRGEPYPLRLEHTGGSDTGKVELKEFGTPVPTATPAPDETVDLDQLDAGTGGGTDGGTDSSPDGDSGTDSGSPAPTDPDSLSL